MAHRLSLAGRLAPAFAWALLGLATATEGSASCTANNRASDAALALIAAGAAFAVAGVLLNVLPFGTGRHAGVFAGGIVLAVVGVLAVGFGVLALVGALLLFGVWRIATGATRGATRTRALLAYLASGLWFPVAGIALLWAALRCFTF
jgi:hypothetical protein